MSIFKKKENEGNAGEIGFTMEQIFRNNEIKTNWVTMIAIMSVCLMMVLYAVGTLVNVTERGSLLCANYMIVSAIAAVFVCFIVKTVGYEKQGVRYVLFLALIFVCGVTNCLYPTTVFFLLFGPLVISTRYYDRKFTIEVAIAVMVIHTINIIINTVLDYTNETTYAFHRFSGSVMWSDLISTFLYMWLMRLFLIILTAYICVVIADGGRKLVEEHLSALYSNLMMKTELASAADIQIKSMPEPFFQDPSGKMRVEAYIRPARETGGDFFDYFMIDENLMAVVVADVSDKGLGAAMFSMQAISTLRFALTAPSNLDLVRAAKAINTLLVKHNREQMFITMWIACIDCRTGAGKFVNAGHEFPMIKKSDGSVEIIENEPQLFMGLFEGIKYEAGLIIMDEGDSLVLYTDGVVDSRNPGDEAFGTDALYETVKNADGALPLLESVVARVDDHIGDANQFDDITVLTVTRSCTGGEKAEWNMRNKWPARMDVIPEILQALNETLMAAGCPDYTRRNLDTAVDDICTNIVDYAYDESVDESERFMEVLCHGAANFARIQFRDGGVPFNPLDVGDPDLSGEPKIGGMGIYLVRKLTDEMKYRYEDGMNILTVTVVWNV